MKRHPGKFYSKVMLFGEYSLIVGSQALTIPYRKYSGSFQISMGSQSEGNQEQSSFLNTSTGGNVSGNTTFTSEGSKADTAKADASRKSLLAYFDFLLKQPAHIIVSDGSATGSISFNSFFDILDLDAFKEDLARGIYFKSDIPEGYGLGSSGALVAAVYDRYTYERINPLTVTDFQILKSILAAMESWFHGTSSGIDPLSCYLNAGLLMNTGRRKTFRTITAIPSITGTFFLVDSGSIRKTGPLVQAFLKKADSPGFRRFLSSQYVPVNNACISAVINGDEASLEKNMRLISELQIQYFREMILPELFDMWKQGIGSGVYSLKLCGSGGGGFLLGYSKNPEILNQLFPDYRFLHLPLLQ
jgi:mevalonate kinase